MKEGGKMDGGDVQFLGPAKILLPLMEKVRFLF